MRICEIDQGIQDWELNSWREFHDGVVNELANRPAYIFRGQADSTWNIKSTIDRLEERYPTRKNFSGGVPNCFSCPVASRDVHLAAFRQVLRGRPGAPPPPYNDDECWALAQHHGLATPMLDWTLSPFVALYFAFEDDVEVNERIVVAVSSTAINEKQTEGVLAPFPYIPPNEASYRLLAQSGLFLRMPRGTDLENYVRTHFADESESRNCDAKVVMIKMKIPNADRVECLKTLNKMNINRMTLFPDADGAARYVNALWEIDFDTSLGYIRG